MIHAVTTNDRRREPSRAMMIRSKVGCGRKQYKNTMMMIMPDREKKNPRYFTWNSRYYPVHPHPEDCHFKGARFLVVPKYTI